MKNAHICKVALLVVISLSLNCARTPEIEPRPAPAPMPPAAPPGFIMKPYQASMHDEMRKSYEQADAIMTGVLAGIHQDNDNRNLLDAYPVTAECRAVDVFNLMVRHLVEAGHNR